MLLDVGANAECRPAHLLHFAVMGAVYAQLALRIEEPRVGLLSIGEEETKGNELTRDAHRALKEAPVRFIGNVEARDVYSGVADVIVCDGFTGNVALKVSEGLAEMVEGLLRNELAGTFRRESAACCRCAPSAVSRTSGLFGVERRALLGVGGVVIVAHGRSSAKAVRNAILLASRFSRDRLIAQIEQGIGGLTVNES